MNQVSNPTRQPANSTPNNNLPQFHQVGILHHPKKPESLDLAAQIETFLHEKGIQKTWRNSAWDTKVVQKHMSEADLLITLGGDGTMLRTARLGAVHGIPMLGVKMGRLGFLAEIFPQDWKGPLTKMLEGNFWVEERLMVRMRVERTTPEGEVSIRCEHDALNDVVLSRGSLARIVQISANLDGGYLTTYTCDGLIVSTATGSTAYSLAAGGPILPPELRNILVIPVAPHMSMDRAVVLAEGAECRLRAFSDHTSMLTVDGQLEVEVDDSDEVIIVGSPHLARFVRMRSRSYFYQTLMEKLKWTG